jgi:hypothetical protein
MKMTASTKVGKATDYGLKVLGSVFASTKKGV